MTQEKRKSRRILKQPTYLELVEALDEAVDRLIVFSHGTVRERAQSIEIGERLQEILKKAAAPLNEDYLDRYAWRLAYKERGE